jgi:hypothetical protein
MAPSERGLVGGMPRARYPIYDSARKWLTVTLAAFVWFMFLVGHIVNNVRGFGS